jgi:hypothetical protein
MHPSLNQRGTHDGGTDARLEDAFEALVDNMTGYVV